MARAASKKDGAHTGQPFRNSVHFSFSYPLHPAPHGELPSAICFAL
jgi:hypothetical protein